MIPGLGGRRLKRSDVNRSRARAAEEEKSLLFTPWHDGLGPLPSASMPALEAGYCARHQGNETFGRFHFAVFRAYFENNRDISDRDVLLGIAMDTGIDVNRLANDMDKGEGREALEQRRDSLMAGGDFTGVPTVFFGNDFPMIGAVPVQVYQQAVERMIGCFKPGA